MNRICERLQKMKTCEYWTIAYRKKTEGGSILQNEKITGFTLLPQKKFVTQADPFLYVHQGKNWLFYEKQNLTDMKGSLWCINLDESGAKPVKVLEEAFHLSYPQVFRYGKYTYLLPETRNAKEVRLYRCVRFPEKWEKVETLFEFPGVDTTLVKKPKTDTENTTSEFFIFTYVEDCLEIYACRVEKEHFRFLEKKRIYRSEPSKMLRPGGFLFEENGKLYRSAQNCSEYYGQELFINEIIRLDEGGFKEQEGFRLSPENIKLPGIVPIGVHTYNRNEQYEVIDILHKEVSFLTMCKKIQWKLWNLLKKEKL